MKQKRVVMFGDSLTDYFPMNKLQDLPVEFINRGVAGDTIPEMKARVQYDVISYNPDVILMQGGANDFQMSLYRGYKIVAGQLVNLAKKIRESLPQTEIYIESLYPAYTRRIGLMPSWAKEKSNEEIRKINGEIERLCVLENFPYVNMYERLADKNGELTLDYTMDGIHLQEKAYDIVSEWIHEVIK